MKILNFGSLNIDYTYLVSSIALPGQTVAALGMNINVGGKGLNQSVALARAGASVFHAGKIGRDGDMLKNYLSESGADVGLVSYSEKPTGNAIIEVDEHGENSIVVYGGANRDITPADADAALKVLSAGDALLLQNEISCADYIAHAAKARGVTVILNPSPVENLSVDMADVDILILNETEARALFGADDPKKVSAVRAEKYPEMRVVLTLGSRGSCFIDASGEKFCAAQRVRAVDTTGAGDTFTGFFLAKYLYGANPEEALKVASRAAAISVTRNGAAASIPKIEEI